MSSELDANLFKALHIMSETALVEKETELTIASLNTEIRKMLWRLDRMPRVIVHPTYAEWLQSRFSDVQVTASSLVDPGTAYTMDPSARLSP